MDKTEFEKMMQEIDDELRQTEIPIHARPIQSWTKVAERLKTRIELSPRSSIEIEGRYDSLTLAFHINLWYEARYGDRLKIHFGPGSVVLLIKGDPWRMILPGIYGAAQIVCEPDIEKYRNSPRMSVGKKPLIFNVLNCIADFPVDLAYQLTAKEREDILLFFITSFKTLQKLQNISNKPYVKESLADLEAAVSCLVSHPAQYGLSKWSSLQFIEKLMKSFIKLKNAAVPHHHKLAQIAQDAKALGLGQLNIDLLSYVQCNAGVRYGEVLVDLKEAIRAHHASIILSQHLANRLEAA
jgi:hypothetical protein